MKIIINLIIGLIISIPMFAQSGYYIYKGQHIELYPNYDKVKILTFNNASEQALSNLPNSTVVADMYQGSIYTNAIIASTSATQSTTDVIMRELKRRINPNISIVLPIYYDENGNELALTNYINIKLLSSTHQSRITSIINEFHLTFVAQDQYMPLWYTLSITPDTRMTTLELANLLCQRGMFAACQPDFSCSDVTDISWDEDILDQWGLYNSVNDTIDIDASSAWNIATGKGVKIAIVDTGVDFAHLDLAENISFASCDTELSYSIQPSQLYRDHGTHVAGIAAAKRHNGLQIAGVAPDAQIMSISNKLMTSDMMTRNLAYGINWAWRNGADVINCSWHSPRCEILADAIMQALENGRSGKGCIVVFAAGNSYGPVNYPASLCSEILAVGAINSSGNRASFSSYGDCLDVVAPGVDILSTIPGNEVGLKNGTSMAAPHVAGIAALILERNPDLTGQQVRDIIEQNTTKVGNYDYEFFDEYPNGTWNGRFGYGLVNAYKALLATPRKQENY